MPNVKLYEFHHIRHISRSDAFGQDTFSEGLKLKNDGVDLAVLGFEAQNPDGYGRLILDSAGGLKKIVEARDATPEESDITFCNSGIMIAEKQTVYALLKNVSNKNAAGEFLTDMSEQNSPSDGPTG